MATARLSLIYNKGESRETYDQNALPVSGGLGSAGAA
jgi:hypothetical protein